MRTSAGDHGQAAEADVPLALSSATALPPSAGRAPLAGAEPLIGAARPLPSQLLQLQRAAGNRAVARMLDRRAIRKLLRAALQGLTSPRFAGDPLLEACYAGRARMGAGQRDIDPSGPVTRVQQALVDLGYDLGPTGPAGDGVDGVYGSITAATVRAFKHDQGLGFDQYGDVGPGTMHRLDELFPAPSPRPDPTPPNPDPTPPRPDPIPPNPDPTPPNPAPPPPVPEDGIGRLAGTRSLSRRLQRAPTQRTGDGSTPAGPSKPPAPGKPPEVQALEIRYVESLENSLFIFLKFVRGLSEERAAQVTKAYLSAPETVFIAEGATSHANRPKYEEEARKDRVVRLLPSAVTSLAGLLGVTPAELSSAAKTSADLDTPIENLEKDLYFGTDSTPTDPLQTKSDKQQAARPTTPFGGQLNVLKHPGVASVYLAMLDKYAKPDLSGPELTAMGANGMSEADVQKVIGDNGRRRLVTRFVVQGVTEYWQATSPGTTPTTVGSDFELLEDSLLAQVFWGNPTAVKNELAIGIGVPEMQLGLVYRPDGTLFYGPDGSPLASFAGGMFRDPGFKAGGKDFGKLINVDQIHDPVIRGFFKLLQDQYGKTTQLAVKGAEAYWQNREELAKRIKAGLGDLTQDFVEAVAVLIGFLTWKAIAFALERSKTPVLIATGASMDLLAEAAGFVLQLDFLGTVEDTLVNAGYEMVHVVPPKSGEGYDALSDIRMNRAVGLLLPLIRQLIVQLVLAAALRVARPAEDPASRAAAKEDLEGVTKGGGRGRILCRVCKIEFEAAEFSKSIGKEIYDDTVAKKKVKAGEVAHHLNPRFADVELHPDGNWYGPFNELQPALNDAKLTQAKGKGLKFEAHHLFEDNQAEAFGITRDEGWCVGVDQIDHQEFSRYMRGLVSRKTTWDLDEVIDLHREMYEFFGHPEYTEQLNRFILEKRDFLIKQYENGRVPGSRRSDFPDRRDRVIKWLKKLR